MIVNKNDEKRLVELPILIPNYDDCDAPLGEKQLSEEEIADFAHKYIEKYRVSDPGHTYVRTKKEVATPVESTLLKQDTVMKNIFDEEVTYPKGTWVVTLKVFDDTAWENIQTGVYTGGSVTVLEEAVADELVAKSQANKGRVLIKDIPDPAVATISLVEKPCVFGATFCSVKSEGLSRADSQEGKRDLIRAALRKEISEEMYIELTFDDKIIVHDWKTEEYSEIPYIFNVNGEVEFGDPVKVEVEYVAQKMQEKITKQDSFDSKIINAVRKLFNGDKNMTNNEYATKKDLEATKKEILDAVKGENTEESDEDKIKRLENELSEKDKEIEKLKEDETEESDEDDDEGSDETDGSTKSNTTEVKGSQKGVDDNGEPPAAQKSDDDILMESMGRTRTGAPKKQ